MALLWDAAADEELSRRVIGCFYDVYNALGHGFLESVYTRAMVIALEDVGLAVQRESPVDVYFRGRKVGRGRVDLLVNERLVVENKAGRSLVPADLSQLLHYLRATDLELGLLLHFGPKPRFERMVSSYKDPRKQVYGRDSAVG